MIFNRQLYKQKPSAWGPASNVQASIFKNAERIGIDPASIALAMPMWWPGNQLDYAKNITGTPDVGVVFQKNSVYLPSKKIALNANVSPPIVNCTLFCKFSVSSLSAHLDVFQSQGATDNYYGIWSNILSTGNIDIQYGNSGVIGSGSRKTFRSYAGIIKTYKDYIYVATINSLSSAELLLNNVQLSVTLSGTASTYSPGTTNGYIGYTAAAFNFNGYIDFLFFFNKNLPVSVKSYISDNPYFLLQRVASVFYSVPGGAITITTSLDGKVIIRTTTSSLLDCMASIKNNASNILDGAAVVSTTKSDAIDGKTILKSVASSIFDSKASVLSIASLLLDGKAIVSETGAALFDGKGTVKDSAYYLVDGKSIIKSTNAAILDGKSIFLSAGGPVIDGKIIVNAEGFSSALFDGKTSIKSVATNYLDGLIYIGNAADKNIDGKAIIKSSLGITMDGKTTIKDVASNLLDGSASIATSIANIVDGKIVISDAAIGLIDGNASIIDDSSIVLDGKVFLSSGSEINVFDGKITLSVPVVGKVTVSFSMRSPSVSFAIRTPAATVSIN